MRGEDRSVRGLNRRGGYRAELDRTEEETSGEGRIQTVFVQDSERRRQERRHQEERGENSEMGGQNRKGFDRIGQDRERERRGQSMAGRGYVRAEQKRR